MQMMVVFSLSSTNRSKPKVWEVVAKMVRDLHDNGLIPSDALSRYAGNGTSISFWLDVWCSDIILRAWFPRLFMLSSNIDSLVSNY